MVAFAAGTCKIVDKLNFDSPSMVLIAIAFLMA